ncbi:MAG TPA: carboxypeptidase-like regulatory domain-containing protein, partial [Terriglobales bacterium]|nr:carboxypeptidase-like regulatory domain-containing protein [Terriglobales bacterium]
MTLHKYAKTLITCLAVIAMCLSAWGQATTSLHGAVTDKSGAVVAHATVIITNSSTNFVRKTKTGSDGVYTFPSVLPGPYEVSVEAQGFRTFKHPGLELQVNLPATLNVQMEVGTTAETVEVTGQAPQLNTTDASVGNTMGSSAIENLPLQGQNMPALLSFQPGVVYDSDKISLQTDSYDTRAGMVNGERSDQNNITLDGVSDNNEFTGYAFQGVLPTTPFSVQEFRVTTSNYGASDARSAGAQISMVTRGGTNNFHGAVYEDNRNDLGEANDWFIKQTQLLNNEPNRPGKLIRNVFGGAVGGPIKKDRLFFFFNYQGTRLAQAATDVVRVIPSATLRDGIIQYKCASAALCPGGTVAGVSGKSYNIDAGYSALSPSQLAAMDPLGIGPSTV